MPEMGRRTAQSFQGAGPYARLPEHDLKHVLIYLVEEPANFGPAFLPFSKNFCQICQLQATRDGLAGLHHPGTPISGGTSCVRPPTQSGMPPATTPHGRTFWRSAERR